MGMNPMMQQQVTFDNFWEEMFSCETDRVLPFFAESIRDRFLRRVFETVFCGEYSRRFPVSDFPFSPRSYCRDRFSFEGFFAEIVFRSRDYTAESSMESSLPRER